jgi:hypothetical protein
LLPRRPQKIRHNGFLSRRSNVDLDDVRDAILESLKDVEPDLELEAWTVPSLRPAPRRTPAKTTVPAVRTAADH